MQEEMQSQAWFTEEKLRLIIREEVERQNHKAFWRRLPAWIITGLSWIERIVVFEHHH